MAGGKLPPNPRDYASGVQRVPTTTPTTTSTQQQGHGGQPPRPPPQPATPPGGGGTTTTTSGGGSSTSVGDSAAAGATTTTTTTIPAIGSSSGSSSVLSSTSSSFDASEISGFSSLPSTYRHHNTGPFMPPGGGSETHSGAAAATTKQQPPPKPVLVKDTQHKPKTTGSFGLLVVGLGGANGTTLLAGILANRLNIQWHGPVGQPMSPNYNGCITQIDSRGKYGTGGGYRDKVKGLANASMAAIGGWDIRPTKPGDALFQAQILDYDLVRQVKDEMNKVKVFRGVYDPRYIGSSQHETASHVLSKDEAPTDSEALKCLRADIRYFKWRNGLVGHTTVVWSASVEPNCDLLESLETADDLLDAIEQTEEERGGPLPPSLLYATAALLEGCSFINGGSQNTLSCPGLANLAKQQTGVYCLGTDFKAGQTKFKTAAVEYLRTMGLTPRVIASSNHLGNNDMRNIASSKTTTTAKLRVKHDIFAPWEEENLDHKVSIMYTPYINDEKRDFVEYTSLGFLGQPHTMVTYTRASDSVLCVPLMLDGAVFCDFFSARSWSYEKVSKALAYLFKVPEGGGEGVDPGFFRQMQELETQVMAAHHSRSGIKRENSVKKRVRIRPDEKTTEWAIPHDARVICAGLACVDMQLNHATGGDGGESIETFEGEKSVGGGIVSMACKTLSRLCHGPPMEEGYMQVTPPVVHSIVPLCKIGNDGTGDKLLSLLEDCSTACRNVETKYCKAFRVKDPTSRTALAILPIYKDGRRGCLFDAASNNAFCARELVEMIGSLSSGSTGPQLNTSHLSAEDIEHYQADLESMTPLYGAFLFGYPHLLPKMQGEALAQVLLEARSSMIEGGIIAVNLNGVPEGTFDVHNGLRSVPSLKNDKVIGASLEHIDILTLNEDELILLTGCEIKGTPESQLEDDYAIASAVNLFLLCGVAVVAVTRGETGSYVSCNNINRFRRSSALPSSWADCTAKVSSVQLKSIINSNGAGDAFLGGFLVAAMLRHTGMTVRSKTEDTKSTAGSNSRKPEESNNPTDASPHKKEPNPKKKKLSPYTLYMRENYMTLKHQYKDDKKKIFQMCHEMWENESDDVKVLYESKEQEEEEEQEVEPSDMSIRVLNDMETLDSTPKPDSIHHSSTGETTSQNLYMTNRSLSLESAVQFASLVAAYHIDVSTRDRAHIDVSQLLERAMVFRSGLEEI